MSKDLKVNNLTFHEFCKEIRGYDIYDTNGEKMSRYVLFFRGEDPIKIVTKQTNYTLKLRIR